MTRTYRLLALTVFVAVGIAGCGGKTTSSNSGLVHYCADVKIAMSLLPPDDLTGADRTSAATNYANKLTAVVATSPSESKTYWQDNLTLANHGFTGGFPADADQATATDEATQAPAALKEVADDCGFDVSKLK